MNKVALMIALIAGALLGACSDNPYWNPNAPIYGSTVYTPYDGGAAPIVCSPMGYSVICY